MSITPQFKKKKEFRTVQDMQVTITCYPQVTITVWGMAGQRVGDQEQVTHPHPPTAFSALSTLSGSTFQSPAFQMEFPLLFFTYLLALGWF